MTSQKEKFTAGGFITGMLIPILTCGALGALKYNDFTDNLEKRAKFNEIAVDVSPKEIIKCAQKETETPKRDYKDLTYLNSYDSIIKETVDYFNKKHNIKINLDLIKAQIKREAGSVKERENSFVYDPMQISTAKKNSALEILVNSGEHTDLIGDFSNLKGKNKPVWDSKNNCWDYSNTGMDAKSSIYGGVGWLLHKSAIYAEKIIEEGNITEYEIKEEDNLWKIAKENNSTIGTLIKYNPNINSTKLQVGQKINFKKARKETYIQGWRNLETALSEYNGGGTPGYAEGIKNNLEEIFKDKAVKINKKIIVLDPGHGMGNRKQGVYDPGAVAGDIYESNITLNQAKKISQILKQRGYDVVLTRSDNNTPTSLSSRTRIAENNNADLFVSLHCNSSGSSSAYGQETLYYGEENKEFAEYIQEELVKGIGKNNPILDRGIKYRTDLRVLKTKIPAVLIESGFLSNQKDRNYLTDNVDNVEYAIANGIDKYLNKVELTKNSNKVLLAKTWGEN